VCCTQERPMTMGDWVGLNEVASLKSVKGKNRLSYVVNAIKFELIACTYLLVSSSDWLFHFFFGMRTNISPSTMRNQIPFPHKPFKNTVIFKANLNGTPCKRSLICCVAKTASERMRQLRGPFYRSPLFSRNF